MNLQAFLKRGAAHAPTEAERAQAAINKAAEATRERWLDALVLDQTRAWMGLGERDPGVIQGLASLLALAAYAHAFEAGSDDTPDLRVIRGGLSAAAQCAEAGCTVTVDHARAFSSAARRAEAIVRSCTAAAIVHAATHLHAQVVPA